MEDFKGKYKQHFNYIAANYEFRFNVVTGHFEYRKIDYGNGRSKKKTRIFSPWKKYNDRVKNLISVELMEADLDLPENKLNAFIESEIMSPEYNPFEDYFSNLQVWDGKTDYIEQLSKTVKVQNSTHFKNTLQKFLVGTLDCLLDEDSVNDVCLVFQSSQGIGKTRWMRRLLPECFRSEYLYEGNIDTKNKDHTLYLSQYWFMHLDELETLKANDISAIKSYITRQRISERKAYGRYKSSYIRRASFLGSVNDDKFLTDITGNRRWLVFKTIEINYNHNVDIDGLWSQVYSIWNEGFRYWFDIEEIKVINEVNEEFRNMSLEEELLLQTAAFPSKSSGIGEFFSSSEIMLKIAGERPMLAAKLNASNMGRALAKHCKDKKRSSGITKYYLQYLFMNTEPDTNPESDQTIGLSQLNRQEFEQRKIQKAVQESEEAIPPDVESLDYDVPF